MWVHFTLTFCYVVKVKLWPNIVLIPPNQHSDIRAQYMIMWKDQDWDHQVPIVPGSRTWMMAQTKYFQRCHIHRIDTIFSHNQNFGDKLCSCLLFGQRRTNPKIKTLLVVVYRNYNNCNCNYTIVIIPIRPLSYWLYISTFFIINVSYWVRPC